MTAISLLSFENQTGRTRSSSLSSCRLKSERSSILSREVGKGSLLLCDAAVDQSQAMRCSGSCSVNVRTTLWGGYVSYLCNYRICSFSWQIDLALGGHAGAGLRQALHEHRRHANTAAIVTSMDRAVGRTAQGLGGTTIEEWDLSYGGIEVLQTESFEPKPCPSAHFRRRPPCACRTGTPPALHRVPGSLVCRRMQLMLRAFSLSKCSIASWL